MSLPSFWANYPLAGSVEGCDASVESMGVLCLEG